MVDCGLENSDMNFSHPNVKLMLQKRQKIFKIHELKRNWQHLSKSKKYYDKQIHNTLRRKNSKSVQHDPYQKLAFSSRLQKCKLNNFTVWLYDNVWLLIHVQLKKETLNARPRWGIFTLFTDQYRILTKAIPPCQPNW